MTTTLPRLQSGFTGCPVWVLNQRPLIWCGKRDLHRGLRLNFQYFDCKAKRTLLIRPIFQLVQLVFFTASAKLRRYNGCRIVSRAVISFSLALALKKTSCASWNINLIKSVLLPCNQNSLFTRYSDVWYEHLNKTRSGNNKYWLSIILRCVVPYIQSVKIFSLLAHWIVTGIVSLAKSNFSLARLGMPPLPELFHRVGRLRRHFFAVT